MLECIREGALHSKTNKKVRGLQFQETFAKRTKLRICNKYPVVSMTSLLTHTVTHFFFKDRIIFDISINTNSAFCRYLNADG